MAGRSHLIVMSNNESKKSSELAILFP